LLFLQFGPILSVEILLELLSSLEFSQKNLILGQKSPYMKHKFFKKERAFTSAGIVLTLLIVQKVFGFAREIVFARMLGTVDYGVLTLALFFIQFVGGFAVLGLPSCYARYIPQYEAKGMLSDFFRKTYLFALVTGLLISILCVLFSKQISSLVFSSDQFKGIIVIASLVIFPVVLYKHLLSSFNGLRIFKMGALCEFSYTAMYTILGVAGLFLAAATPSCALKANLLSLVIVVFVFALLLQVYLAGTKNQENRIEEKNFNQKLFSFSIWFVLAPIVFMLFNYIDRLMLTRMAGLHDVGVYSVASHFTMIIFMFGMIIGNVLMPNLSHLWEKQEKEKAMFIINFSAKATILLLLVLCLVIALFKTQWIQLFYGEQYTESVQVIPTLLVFWLLNSLVWTIGVYPQLIEKTYLNLIATIPGLLLNLVLNYYLIPRWGILGAAIATTSSFAVLSVTILLLYKRENLQLTRKTLAVCLLPLGLFLNSSGLILFAVVLLFLVFKTDYLIDVKEKELLQRQLKGVLP